MTKVSIAMATYNGARHLQEQLQSFINQTRQPDELVICDDGSTDGTDIIVESFCLSSPFKVHFIKNNSNIGYVRNFEKAVSLCTGDLIAFSDQDDVWLPEKLAKVINVFEKNDKIELIQTDMELADQNMNPSGVTQIENILALGGKINDCRTGCGIIVRKHFASISFPTPDQLLFGHDTWIYRIGDYFDSVYVLRNPMSYYRRHEKNVSQSLASSIRQLSTIDSFKAHGLRPANKGWQEEMHRLNFIEIHLTEQEVAFRNKFGDVKYENAIKRIKFERSNLAYRLRIASKPRIFRASDVLSMLLKGKYKQFAGWKSAIKDLIRP